MIYSPRGMLGAAALGFSGLRKRAFWRVLQQGPVLRATCLHATSEQEYRDIREFGLGHPVAIVPNGITVGTASKADRPRQHRRTLLFLGRVHPKKGVDVLLKAWAALATRHPEWHLDVVGPLEGEYVTTLPKLAREIPRVRLLEPAYGAQKEAIYRDAELFVLPSRNENFGMTVAEALSQGTPVIASRGTPWEGLEANRCGWWVDLSLPSFTACLDEALASPPATLIEMGRRGQHWMQRDFGWDQIAAKMAAVYAWAADGAPAPNFVVRD